MKVNKCKCGILKNVDSDVCCVCKGTPKKATVKVRNTAIIKENNLRNKKQ